MTTYETELYIKSLNKMFAETTDETKLAEFYVFKRDILYHRENAFKDVLNRVASLHREIEETKIFLSMYEQRKNTGQTII